MRGTPRTEAAHLPQSHADSDSSSSHSHQETPPTAAAGPIVTVESASAFGPATPPQRRRSSAQVRSAASDSWGGMGSGAGIPKGTGAEVLGG
jgi:hypothetical protein